MSEYAVLSNSGMAVGWEMGRVRGIWTIYACWQWWMLAPKYSISDFFPPSFIYLYIPWNWGHFWPLWWGGYHTGKGEEERRTLAPCDGSFTNGYWLPSERLSQHGQSVNSDPRCHRADSVRVIPWKASSAGTLICVNLLLLTVNRTMTNWLSHDIVNMWLLISVEIPRLISPNISPDPRSPSSSVVMQAAGKRKHFRSCCTKCVPLPLYLIKMFHGPDVLTMFTRSERMQAFCQRRRTAAAGAQLSSNPFYALAKHSNYWHLVQFESVCSQMERWRSCVMLRCAITVCSPINFFSFVFLGGMFYAN